ncbi:hypothetical protein MPER_01786, partial [Moniliophthora perniciosa FA553]
MSDVENPPATEARPMKHKTPAKPGDTPVDTPAPKKTKEEESRVLEWEPVPEGEGCQTCQAKGVQCFRSAGENSRVNVCQQCKRLRSKCSPASKATVKSQQYVGTNNDEADEPS